MVFVIAATNRPDIIDEAVLRSGRIEKHLYVPLPNQQERLQILKAITSKVSCQHPLELSSVAEKATGFSGADLYFIVKKAITSAVSQDRDRIKSEDLIKAFKSYKNDKYSKKNGLQMTQAKEETQDDDLLPVLDSNDHKIPKPIEEHL